MVRGLYPRRIGGLRIAVGGIGDAAAQETEAVPDLVPVNSVHPLVIRSARGRLLPPENTHRNRETRDAAAVNGLDWSSRQLSGRRKPRDTAP